MRPVFVCQRVTLQRLVRTQTPERSDETETRDALQLLIFHLMRQTPALIQSIYLGLTLICRDAACQTASGPLQSVRQLQTVFHLAFSAVTTAVQRFSQSSSKRSAITFSGRARVSFWASQLSTLVRKLADVDASLQILIRGCFRFLLR